MARVITSRKSGFIRRDGVMRRESLWLTQPMSNTVLAAASSAVLLGTLNATALQLRPFTVVRTRGFWQIKSDQTGATETYAASLGHAVVSDQAAAIGVTAVPTPETDRDSDLFYVYESMSSQFLFISGVGIEGANGTLLEIDSKAMRKVEGGQDLAITVENSALFAGGTAIVTASRILIKLH